MKPYVTRTMFLRLLMYTLAVIFFLNLFMGALTYFYFKDSIQKRETERSQETLIQTKERVESTIQEIQRVAMAISENIAVRKLLVLPDGRIGYTDAQAVIGMLNEKINSTNYLHSIYLYNEHIGKVISADGIIDLEQFWDRGIIESLQGEPPYDSWMEPHAIPGLGGDAGTDGASRQAVTYALRIPEGENYDSFVIMNIRMETFYQTYIELYQNTNNDVAILNAKGRTIIYNDDSVRFGAMESEFRSGGSRSSAGSGWFTKTIDGVPMLVAYVRSDFNGWLYIKAAPLTEVYKESNVILKVVAGISLICLIAGAFMALLMSNRYYKPIDSFVHELMEENETVREEMKRHEATLKDHFLLGLLLGRRKDPDDIRRSVRYYGLSLPESGYVVLLLHLHALARSNSELHREQNRLIAYRVGQACEQFLANTGGGEAVPLDHRRIALIVPQEAGEAAGRRKAKLASDWILRETGMSVTVGVGGRRERLHEIHGSYDEAGEALSFESMAGAGSVIGISDIRPESGGTREWMDFNRKVESLQAEIKLGNAPKAMERLAEMLEGIGDNQEVNYREKQLLLGQLVYAVVTAMMEISPTLKGVYEGDPFADYNRLTTPDQIKDWLRTATAQAVRYVKEKRENKNVELIGEICAYLERNYAEELTLQSAAEQALLNPQYFSKIFKDVTGKTFLEYLTDIRLTAAKRLLEAGEAKIYEVAERTGFGNKTNLIRAFKKHCNMTPTDYRNVRLRGAKTDVN